MSLSPDSESVLAVLEWGRQHGVALATVSVGTCSVTLYEAQAAGDGKREQPRRGGDGIYAAMGGEVWKHAVRAGDIEGPGHGATEAEDLEPAVEATR